MAACTTVVLVVTSNTGADADSMTTPRPACANAHTHRSSKALPPMVKLPSSAITADESAAKVSGALELD